MFHVRLPREFRRRHTTAIPVMLPPPPTYQQLQPPYGYASPGVHIQAPPGATVQPYVAGPATFTPAVYGQSDGQKMLNPPYYVPQQHTPPVPIGGTPIYGHQTGVYGQYPVTEPWHIPSLGHMSAVPKPTGLSKTKLKQRLMGMFRLPVGHASTITGSPPTPKHVSRAGTPYPASVSRHSSPARPSTRRSMRSVRDDSRQPIRTASPGPRRSIHSYRYASPIRRSRSESPRYVYRKYRRQQPMPEYSYSSSTTSSSSSGSGCSTAAVIRSHSRASDRT